MVGYRKFVYETRWIPESAFDAIWALCREFRSLRQRKPRQPSDRLQTAHCGAMKSHCCLHKAKARSRMKLLELARLLKPSYRPDWYHELLADLLERCAARIQT